MYGLKEEFGDEIQFIWLNVDNPSTLPLRRQFNIEYRTNYVLVDAEGEVVQRWVGYLYEPDLEEALSDFLESTE